MKMINNIRIMLLFGWLIPGLIYGQTEQKRSTQASGGLQENGTLRHFISVGVPVVGQLVKVPVRTDIGFQNVPNDPVPPVMEALALTFEENVASGTLIGTALAYDPNGQAITYGITQGEELVAIDPMTGEITIKDSAYFDFETNYETELVITASDGQLTAEEVVSVQVINVNEQPVVFDQNFSIAENTPSTSEIGTVQATDVDSNTQLIFEIIDGNELGTFALATSTGLLTVGDPTALDYELNQSLVLSVLISDGELTTEALLNITITDVDENQAPVIADQTLTVAESLLLNAQIGQIIASDPEAEILSYNITGGVDAGFFTVDASTGLLSLGDTSFDFETKSQYEIVVEVSDGEKSTNATISVVVTDVNESPFITAATFEVAEDASIGTSISTIAVSDPENDTLTYSIVSGNSEQKFTIDPATGLITVSGALSVEIADSYTLGIQVSDGTLTTLENVIIVISDVNEAPTLFDLDFTVPENSAVGVLVGQLIGEDPEQDTLTFSIISGNGEGIFSLDSATGEITVADASKLDFETLTQVDLVVLASDGALLSEEVIISIFIQDLAEGSPPVAFSPDFTVYQLLTDPLILAGYDPDNDPFSVVITGNPDLGTLTSTSDPELWNFAPEANLSPETIYTDSVNYKLVENTAAALESNEATYRFKFELTDQPQVIQAFEVGTSSFDLSWIDPVINDTYKIEVGYFDLSTGTPEQKVLFMDDNVSKSTLSIDGTTATYTGTIEAADHPFIFSGENVFIFVDVITANGFISSTSYIYNSGSGGRIEASPDGLFFAFGNQLAVRENATAQLKLQAVELGDFSLTGAAVEVITPPENGSLGVATLASVEERILTWELPYTGTREVGGSDSVQFRIYHPDRQLFDTAWVQINVVDVNDQPTITAITDQQMEEDEVLSLNVDIEDPDSQLEIISTSNEASSVPVSYDRGVLTVTPKEDFFGSVSISIVAQEVGTAEQFLGYEQFDLEIIPVNDAPVVTAVNDQSIDEDQSLQIVLSATDADNANAVFVFEASSNAPSSVKTSVLGSNLSIVPEANVFGDFEVSVTANDQSGTATALSAPVNFTVSIAAVNDAPEITKTIETQNLIANFPSYDIDLSAFFTDIESGDELTYQFAGNSQVLLDVNEQILTVSLTQGFTGVEDVTITASDGSLSVSQSVTFVVTEASTDVSISSPVADLQLLEDFAAFTLDVSNVFTSSASGAIFSYQLIGNSFILPLISDDEQTITFSPTADFNGTEKMILLGTANGKTAFDEFEIVVSPVNDAPVLTAIEDVTINEDQALSNLFIEATDIDNVELSLALVSSDETLVKNSSISVSTLEGGFLVGLSPEADKNGSVDLYVTLSDGTLEQQDTFNIEVKPIDDAPMITSVSAPGAIEDQLYQLELSDFFSEPDGESFTVTVTQKPLWMTVGQGTISGTPENEDVGDWSIRLKASDTSQNSVQRVLDVTVENVNDAPIINQPLADIQVLQGSAWSYSLPSASFEDIDADDVLTLSFDRKPSWTSVSNGSLVGTPAYEDIGSSEVIVSATDQAGATIIDTFSVEVIFTDYEVEISISELMICLGLEGTVAAEGAFDYNWYEADSLIQDGGAALTYVFREGVQYFVKGKDEQGRTTASRFLVPIELIAGPEIEVTASGDRLSVATQDSNLSFQWYDSEGAIEGATGATFNATGSGDYYVIATNEAGCFTASESINYILSLNDLSRINMYPNPAIDVVNLTDVPIGATIQILELSGRTMHEYSKNRDTSIQLDVSGYKPGVYFLKITNEHSNQIFKLIKH